MSNLKIDKSTFNAISIEIKSNAPYDDASSENNQIEYTYDIDAQRYEFNVDAETYSHEQYASFSAIMEQVGGFDSFLFDVKSFGNDPMPSLGTQTNSLYTHGVNNAGATELVYDNTTGNPSGVAPDGVIGVGSFIQIGTTNNKLFKVTSASSASVDPSKSVDLTLTSTGTTAGTITVTVGGTAFTSTVVTDVTATATDLASTINADAAYDATSTLGVITITAVSTSLDFSTAFAGGTADYSGAFNVTEDGTVFTEYKYGIYPSLRNAIAAGTEIIHGNAVVPRVKMDSPEFSYTSSPTVPLKRTYGNLKFIENPF